MGTALIIGGIPDPQLRRVLHDRISDSLESKAAAGRSIFYRMFHKNPYHEQARRLLDVCYRKGNDQRQANDSCELPQS